MLLPVENEQKLNNHVDFVEIVFVATQGHFQRLCMNISEISTDSWEMLIAGNTNSWLMQVGNRTRSF